MLHSGPHKAVNDAFRTFRGTYIGNDRPRTVQASSEAVIKRYGDRDLTAKQLADFTSAFYEAIVKHEQGTWLSRTLRI